MEERDVIRLPSAGCTRRRAGRRLGAALLLLGLVAPAIAEDAGEASGQTWPGDTTDLVFLWEDADSTNQIIGPDGRRGATCRVTARGLAHYGRHHNMVLTGDAAFRAEDADADLLAAAQRTGELTLEALITPANLDPAGYARIISFANADDTGNFTLSQKGNQLWFRLRTTATGDDEPPAFALAELEAGRTHHVIISYRQGRLNAYIDGEHRATSEDANGHGDLLSNWNEQRLLFGDDRPGEPGWAGRLEGVALFARAVDSEEAAHRHQLARDRLADRKPAARFVVKAKRVETSAVPTPDDIAPYRRALVTHTYTLQAAHEGSFDHARFQVAHWAIMDTTPIKRTFDLGEAETLHLERFDAHPQLMSERLISDSDEFDLPLFIDVGPVQ